MTNSTSSKAPRRRAGGRSRPGRPPGSFAEDTVPRVVAAALEQFGTNGYGGARMTEIATSAGITHSSIYQYFASKRELYRAAFDAAQSELLPEYRSAIAAEGDFRGRVRAIFRASARIHTRNPAITPFLASLPIELRRHPDLLPSLQTDGDDLVSVFVAMFDEARQKGEINTAASDLDLTAAFMGAAMGIGLFSYGVPGSDMDSAVDVLINVFDGTFFG